MNPQQSTRGRWQCWPRNVRLFLLFRVFFNARYYYPIFALLFLDLGLSLAQFAALNALWAATIVTLEVPSGALADILGRRKLLRGAAVLMVVEMACLLLPRWDPDLLLLAMAVNRVCSGAAEALASGADEALAYDSLPAEQKSQWSEVLELQMRYLNLAMMVTMLVGATSYDPALWSRWLPAATAVMVASVAPVVLTLIHALIVVIAVIFMQEAPRHHAQGARAAVRAAFRQTRETVGWLLRHSSAKMVIVSAVLFDHLTRQGLVVSSDYLHAIGVPKAWLGLLGAASALVSSLFARPLSRLARRLSPASMFWLLYTALAVTSLGLAHPHGKLSAIWIIALGVLAGSTGYLTSLYLNQLADQGRRATLLSVKGLVINLGYGWISLAYAGWVGRLPKGAEAPVVGAFSAYLPYATVLVLVVFALARRQPQALGGPGGFPGQPES